MPMIAITTNNSTSVNAQRERERAVASSRDCHRIIEISSVCARFAQTHCVAANKARPPLSVLGALLPPTERERAACVKVNSADKHVTPKSLAWTAFSAERVESAAESHCP